MGGEDCEGGNELFRRGVQEEPSAGEEKDFGGDVYLERREDCG